MNYENLDNHQTGIHDYFKYLKFGSAARRTSRRYTFAEAESREQESKL